VNIHTFDDENEQPVAKQGVVSVQTLALNLVEVKLLLFFFPLSKKINLSSPKYLSKVIPTRMFKPNKNAFNASVKFFF
jgi:hypothetical protein